MAKPVAFIEETDSARKAAALETLFRAPKETGIDCLAVPFIVVQAVFTWPGQRPDWLQTADKNYASQFDGNGEGKLPLNLRLGDPSVPPEQFVADYTWLFDDGTGGAAAPDPVRAASEKAFEATVAYFRENSFYASPTGMPREP